MVAYEGKEPYAFVSYSHKDKNLVLPIIQGLQDRGFRVWYDEGIEVGNEWPDFIAEHLENCACVLSFVSQNFGDSHNCRQEFTFSQNLHKDNSVVYLEDPKLLRAGLRMQLSNLHALYYDKYGTSEKLLKELAEAKVLKPCVRDAAPSVKSTDPVAEKLYDRADAYFNKGKYKEAVQQYKKAAMQGHGMAMNMLGICLDFGWGVEKNHVEAVKYYRQAAMQGLTVAQRNLGWCYETGRGVRPNDAEARKWYQMAADQGDKEAMEKLKTLK